MTRYQTIVADPPWHYEQFAPSQWKDREWRLPKPYASMPAEDIAGLPIRSLADVDCRLFLWATNRYLPTAITVLGRWGFQYRQLIVWKKTGNPLPLLAHIAPSHAEYLLVGTFGSPKRLGGFPSNVIEAPKGASAGSHSRKPDVFIDLIEQVSPGPYLELFARRQRLGWDTWGNEALEHVDLDGSAA